MDHISGCRTAETSPRRLVVRRRSSCRPPFCVSVAIAIVHSFDFPPFPIHKNKKALVPCNQGTRADSCGTTHIHPFNGCTRSMHLRCMLPGKRVKLPSHLTPDSASDCPHKSIQHCRRRHDPTIRGSLCTPETAPTILTQRFHC